MDLGLGIVKADAEQPLAMVLDLHQRASSAVRQAQGRTGVNPGMAGDNAISLAGAQQNSGKGGGQRFHNFCKQFGP